MKGGEITMHNEIINKTNMISVKGILNKGIPFNIQKLFNKEINYSTGKPNSCLYSLKNKTMYKYDDAGNINHIYTPSEDCSIKLTPSKICLRDNSNSRTHLFNLI